jgi:TrmH family RNA methyltransferase
MGAIFRLELAVVEPDDLLQAAARTGYRIVAAVKNGSPLSAFIWPSRSLIAVGNERRGVSDWLPRYDDGVTIPQAGDGESLNAAVAGSIVLYAFSQRS